MDRRSSLRPVTVPGRSSARPTPIGDTIEDAEAVEAMVLASAGSRLPTSQPALDDYDQALVDAAEVGARLFPHASPSNDGHPGTPTLLYPLHQATGVPTTVTLTWASSDETDGYQIRFGTTDDPPPLMPGCITATEWQPPILQPNTTYYWRVISTDSCGHTTSSVQRSFTTGS